MSAEIIKAADELEAFLHHNSGTTGDWPVDIQVDNQADADKLTALLQALRDALKPFREGRT